MQPRIVLVEPEIPQNTGNIARTCAATGAELHLVRPLGFSTDDRALKRAGLDYWHLLKVVYHDSLEAYLEASQAARLYFISKKASRTYTDFRFEPGSHFVFGKETRGLPESLLSRYPERCCRIPMIEGARSLNLSNSVAIVVYEALRQHGFPGLAPAWSG